MKKENTGKLYWQEFIRCLSDFYGLFSKESDRGSVIVGAALLDEFLENLIKTRLMLRAIYDLLISLIASVLKMKQIEIEPLSAVYNKY
jgi:hypothetical protein